MRRSFGPLWAWLLKRAGLKDVKSRNDMEELVGGILALGL